MLGRADARSDGALSPDVGGKGNGAGAAKGGDRGGSTGSAVGSHAEASTRGSANTLRVGGAPLFHHADRPGECDEDLAKQWIGERAPTLDDELASKRLDHVRDGERVVT